MKSLQIFGTIAALIWGVSAQFPRDCTTDIALNDRECCPLLVTSDGISSKCGTMQQRGNCEDIEIFVDNDLDNETEFQLSLDERKMWPKMFYDRACKCHGNFDGINCGVCKPGYGGPNCESVMPLLVRKNILKMPRNEVNEFVDVLDKSKHTTSERYVILTSTYDQILAGARPQFSNISVYDLFVWMHYYVARNNLVPNERNIFDEVEDIELVMAKLNPDLDINDEHDYAHEGPAFLPWHRYFLLKWENEVRELMGKPGFTIPYWDWRESETCEVCNDEFMGGRSSNNVNLISNESVFSKWQVICTKDDEYILNGKQCDGEPEGPLLRNFGAYDPSVIAGLPTTEDVRTSLRFSAYETFPYNRVAHGSFRNVIEGFADPKSGEATAGFSTMHNAVHLYMNGTMSEVGSSANDPIFILHHAFIDSIYELWLQEQSRQQLFLSLDGPRSNISVGHNLQDFMVPFFPLVRQIEGFRTSAELGLKYEYIPESEAGSGDFDVDVQIDEDIGKRSDKKESPNNVLDFIFEENLIQAEERFFSEGNFEALTVEGVVSTVTKMKVVKRISRVRPIKKKTVFAQGEAEA
uniref:tyrosinase-like n=1 Tax=Styela clava TaxID=7725 RepID=UPI001939C146|nr:tyrosinase-like [Styela clava]